MMKSTFARWAPFCITMATAMLMLHATRLALAPALASATHTTLAMAFFAHKSITACRLMTLTRAVLTMPLVRLNFCLKVGVRMTPKQWLVLSRMRNVPSALATAASPAMAKSARVPMHAQPQSRRVMLMTVGRTPCAFTKVERSSPASVKVATRLLVVQGFLMTCIKQAVRWLITAPLESPTNVLTRPRAFQLDQLNICANATLAGAAMVILARK